MNNTCDLPNLLMSLIDGAFDVPRWGTFLDRLRNAVDADYAVLIVHPPGRPMDEGLRLVSEGPLSHKVASLCSSIFCPPRLGRRDWPEDGKPFALDTLLRSTQSVMDAYAELVDDIGIKNSQQVRISGPNGVEGWLAILSGGNCFTGEDRELLSSLALPLRGMLRALVAAERGRFSASMSAEAVRRLQCGWLLLDQTGHILAADEFADNVLETSGVLARSVSGRVTVRPEKLGREVLGYVEQLALRKSLRPRAISLRSDPWLDMLLVPARKAMISETAVPAVIAYIHSDNWHSADRCGQLCDLFDLSPSEARLALALCRGKSIAEAAEDLGLALGTARSYSKSIYAKTGTRGMADLVRIIMGSVLALAPDT